MPRGAPAEFLRQREHRIGTPRLDVTEDGSWRCQRYAPCTPDEPKGGSAPRLVRVGADSGRGLSVFDLFEASERMIEARVRREDPAATPTAIRAAVDEWAGGGDRHLDADGYLREVPVPAHWR